MSKNVEVTMQRILKNQYLGFCTENFNDNHFIDEKAI